MTSRPRPITSYATAYGEGKVRPLVVKGGRPAPVPALPCPWAGWLGVGLPRVGGWVEGLPRGGVAGETGPSQPFLDQRHLLV